MITWYFANTAVEWTQTCAVSGWLRETGDRARARTMAQRELRWSLAGETPADRPVLVIAHPITMHTAPGHHPRYPDEHYTLTA